MQQKLLLPFMVLLSSLMLNACGGNSSDPPTPPVTEPKLEMNLNPARLEINPGESSTLSINLTREGELGAALLSLAGAPDGISGTFSPNPADGQTELTLNVAATVEAKTYSLFVQAQAGETRQAQKLEVVVRALSANTITVTGKVLNDVGIPFGNARARIGSTVANTNAAGEFKIENIKTPYDLVIALPASANRPAQVHVFEGLTRPDLTLPLALPLNLKAETPGNATVLGTLFDGAGFPNPIDHVTRVGFASTTGAREQLLSEERGPDYTTGSVFFQGARTQGTLYALQYLENTGIRGRIEKYTGYAEKPLELIDEAEFNKQNLNLQPVTTSFLTANVTLPTSLTLNRILVGVELGGGEIIPIKDSTRDTTVTYAVPQIGKRLSLHVVTNRDGFKESEVHRGGLLPNDIATLIVPTPPNLLEPANNASVDAQTRFAWTPLEGGISIVEFSFPGRSPVFVYTSASETHLPDVRSEGINPIPNTFLHWFVRGFGPYASLDAFAAPESACGLRCDGTGRSYFTATSQSLNFTTK